MRTKKQIRHDYAKYLCIYMNAVDACRWEQADRWFLRAKTLADDVLERDTCHDLDRLINIKYRHQLLEVSSVK